MNPPPHIRWPEYWSFRSSPSNEYSGLISFRIDWFDLLAVQGTLKSLLLHSSKASILLCSPLFLVQLSHDYWKDHSFDYTDLCWQSDVSAFYYAVYVCHSFPSKEQTSFHFIAVLIIHSDFGAQEYKICHGFQFLPITICHEVTGLDAKILAFCMLSFKPAFSLSSFALIKRILIPVHFLPLE